MRQKNPKNTKNQPTKKKKEKKESEPVTLIISGSASVSPVRRFLVFWNRRRLYLLITGRKEEM